MWGIAWSWTPKDWRIGPVDAFDYDDFGRKIIVGRWYCFGPVALTRDYDFWHGN